jgi:hypothetical protein
MAERAYLATRGELLLVAVLFVGAVCLVERTTWGSPYAFGLAFDLVAIVVSGYFLKLGDDLVDEWRLIRLGGVVSCVAVLGLCVIVGRRQELFWLVGGGAVGILAARKVDHGGAVLAYVGFWVMWAVALFLMRARLRPELLVLGAVGIAVDKYLESWATRRTTEARSASGLMQVFVRIARGRWMVTVLTVILTGSGVIRADSCALILGFELGYSFGEEETWGGWIGRRIAGAVRHE